MMTTQMYDAQASSIKIEDIAANKNNRIVLERMRRNENDSLNILYIQNQHDDDGEHCVDYVPEGANDMGWLGYFVNESDNLDELHIRHFGRLNDMDVIKPFFSGFSNNKSIHTLNFFGMDLLGGKMFSMMGEFFKNNNNISVLSIEECFFLADEGPRPLAMALGSFNSLTELTLMGINIADEGLVDIITSLSMHPNLHYLDLDGNRLGTNGCKALSTLLKCSVTKLETLDIRNNQINDEGIDALVPALKSRSSLGRLIMCGNSITSRGWQHLAAIFDAPNSNLDHLRLSSNIDNEAVTEYAASLVNNRTLTSLSLVENTRLANVTERGWKALSKLLCDTSSVNSTFLSNHTLRSLGGSFYQVNHLLSLNESEDKKEVAMIKILQNHIDFDMTPFFEWEFKVLPIIIDWFERASSIIMPEDYEPNIGPRKLSSIYQFVRGMPVLFVEAHLKKELEDIKAAESREKVYSMEEEEQYY